MFLVLVCAILSLFLAMMMFIPSPAPLAPLLVYWGMWRGVKIKQPGFDSGFGVLGDDQMV